MNIFKREKKSIVHSINEERIKHLVELLQVNDIYNNMSDFLNMLLNDLKIKTLYFHPTDDVIFKEDWVVLDSKTYLIRINVKEKTFTFKTYIDNNTSCGNTVKLKDINIDDLKKIINRIKDFVNIIYHDGILWGYKGFYMCKGLFPDSKTYFFKQKDGSYLYPNRWKFIDLI